MIVYPAIDLHGGRVVRLQEGDPNRETAFSDDPIATAQRWIDQGSAWIHMVNLDGAFAQANDNERILAAVAGLGTKVQFGGGLRSIEDVARALDMGAARVVLGTLAVKQPEAVRQSVERFGPESVCVALDARDGFITTHGWQQAEPLTPLDFGQQMASLGVRYALYTDVSRDGQLSGVDVAGTVALAQATNLDVIASGGVEGLNDIRALAASGKVAGIITGMALYTGRFSLSEAIAAAGENYAG